MIKKTIRIYMFLLLGFNISVGFTFGTYVLFLKENGLDLFQVSLVNFFFMATIFILEIPTGSLADAFGRRVSFLLSCVFYVIGGLWYFFLRGFWNFVAAEVWLAIGSCLMSGAFDAWLVDSIRYYGFTGDLKMIFGKKQWYIKLAQIPAALFGTWLAGFDLSYIWLAKAIGIGLVGAAAFFLMKENYPLEKKRGLKAGLGQMKVIARESIKYGLGHPKIFWLMATTSILMACSQPLNMYWSILFEGMLGGKDRMGFIWAGIDIAILAGIYLGGKVLPKFLCRDGRCLAWGFGVTAFSMALAGSFENFGLTLAFFLSHEMGRGMIMPLNEATLHHCLPSEKRATVASFQSMVNKGGAALGLVGFGLLSKNFGIQISWLAAGLLLFLAVFMCRKLKD
jgi:MFS family permease